MPAGLYPCRHPVSVHQGKESQPMKAPGKSPPSTALPWQAAA